MKGFLVVLAFLPVPPESVRPELPTESLTRKDITPTVGLDQVLKELAQPCPDRIHINDIISSEEGDRFGYRFCDMLSDCEYVMNALVKTREPVDDRLLEMGDKGEKLPERFRAAWILTQRRNAKVVPILEKMAGSSSAEERYLSWHLYGKAITERQLLVPKTFDAALARCREEKNRYVRGEIMDFFGACRAKEAIPLLTAALDDDPQYSAVEALGEIRDPKTAPAVLARAKKETYNRHIYFRVLGRLATPEAVDYLVDHLDEGCFAVKALFESGNAKALPALEKYLERLKAKELPSELDLAVARIAILWLKENDPREQLLVWAGDRTQSERLRSGALEALEHYDAKPLADRLLKQYRGDNCDSLHMYYVRLLRDLPGEDITEAMIDQALAVSKKKEDRFSHEYLVQALNQRLNTSFRDMGSLSEYLQRRRETKGR
jgi:HEAT repeat protein